MGSAQQGARALARRLIEQEESRSRSLPSAESAPLEACYRLHLNLCTWIGGIGCSALTSRALRAAESAHPVLEQLAVGSGGRPYFERVPEAIEAYNAATLAAGLEAFLEELLVLLARFVGDDVVVSLTERTADSGQDDVDEPIGEP